MVLRPTSQDPATVVELVERLLRAQPLDLLTDPRSVQELLDEIDRDPTGIFWG